MTWMAGAICNGTNPNAKTTELLAGRHLRVGDLWWPPYAAPDNPAHPTGWSGFNIDLLDDFSAKFGFTYEIVDVGYPTDNETWQEFANRMTLTVDLLAQLKGA